MFTSIVASALLLITFAAPAATAAPIQDIVIGVEAPLTGAQARVGQDILRGVNLAAAQANEKGGILGHRIRIIELDDQADPGRAAAMVTKAHEAGALAVVGPFNTSVGEVNLPLYLKAGIIPLHLTPSARTNGMGITLRPKDSQITAAEYEFITKLSTGCPSLSAFYDGTENTRQLSTGLATKLVCGDGTPRPNVSIPTGLTSYSPIVNNALTSDPAGPADPLYVSTSHPTGAKFAQAIVGSDKPGSGWGVDCLMGPENVTPEFVTAAGVKAAQRCWFSGNPAAAQMPGAKAASYTASYKRAYKQVPGIWGAFAYDSAKLLLTTIAKTGETEFNPVLSNLRNTKDYKGATGLVTVSPSTGNRKNAPVYILNAKRDGTFTIFTDKQIRRLANIRNCGAAIC